MRSGSVSKATKPAERVALRIDPRVERTRELLVESFVALCAERGGHGAVSIADMARRARVNRATFYRHFEDKADLLDRGLESLLASLGDRIDEGMDGVTDSPERITRRVERIFTILAERRAFFLRLLIDAAGPAFRKRVEGFFERYLVERRIERFSDEAQAFSIPRPLLPRAIASIFLGLASWWLEHPGVYDAKEMTGHYLSFLARGIGMK
jgi:AcrR family transcriptional regulator